MKKPTLFLLLLCFVLLSACGGGTILSADASLSDISGELQQSFDETDVTVLNREYMLLLYGLDERDYTEAAAFRVKHRAFPEEVVLIRAADEERRDAIRTLLESYRSGVVEQSRSYEPESCAVFEKCPVETDGLYVSMILSGRNRELTEQFRAHLKKYPSEEVPVFTPVPTPEPTPEPTPVPTPEPASEDARLPWGLVPESERAQDAWFDDVLFVGNSITDNLRDYVTGQRLGENPDCMGKAVFFTVSGFTYAKALTKPDPAFPSLNGSVCSVEEAVASTGAKKVFLNLGYSDLVMKKTSKVDVIVDDAAELVRRIREKNPDVTVVLISVLPRLSVFDRSSYGSPRIRELNAALLKWCEENGAYFIDCYAALAGEDGGLVPDYYRGYFTQDGAHLNENGARVWLDSLYVHTFP